MAAHRKLCLPHDRVFFIYDSSVVCKEEDDPKDAIVIFFPPNVSDDDQCALCGQLIGTVRFATLALGSPPKLVRLKHEKFAVKIIRQYTMVMCGSHDDIDNAVISQMDTLCNMLLFYHGGLPLMTVSYNRKDFAHHIRTVMESYLPFSRCYGDTLSSAFTLVPEVDLPKSETEVFLSASNILQTCHRQPSVLAGAVLNNQRVVCSQLPNEITSQLLIIKAHQTHLPCKHIDTGFPLPDGVRLIDVYLSSYYTAKLRRDENERTNTQKYYTPSNFKLIKSNLKSPAGNNIIKKQMINTDLVNLKSDVSIQDSVIARKVSPCVTLDTERPALDTSEDMSQILNSVVVRTVSTLTDYVPDDVSNNKENINIIDSENHCKNAESIEKTDNYRKPVNESEVLCSLENNTKSQQSRDDSKDKCLLKDINNDRSDDLSSDISYKINDSVSDKDDIQMSLSSDTVTRQLERTSALTLNESSDRDINDVVINNNMDAEAPSLGDIDQSNVSASVCAVSDNKLEESSKIDKLLQYAGDRIPKHDLDHDISQETKSDESIDELLNHTMKANPDLEVISNVCQPLDENLCKDDDSDIPNTGPLTQASDVIDEQVCDEPCDTEIERHDDASDVIVIKSDNEPEMEKGNEESVLLSSELIENADDSRSHNVNNHVVNHEANNENKNDDGDKDSIGEHEDVEVIDDGEMETARTDKVVDNMCIVEPHMGKDNKNGLVTDANKARLCELENTLYSYEQCVYKKEGGSHKRSSIYNVALEIVAKDHSSHGYVHRYDAKHRAGDVASPGINDSAFSGESRDIGDTMSTGLPDDAGQSSNQHHEHVKVNLQVKKEKRVTIIDAPEEHSSESVYKHDLTDSDAAMTALDVLANEHLEQFTLYIQGHSETLLILLMENEARHDSTTINSLWQTALPQLGDLDYRVKECLQISEKQRSSHGYSFLHFDGYQHTMKGSIHEAVTAGENEFFRLVTCLHQDFANKGFSDVTAKSHGAAIYAHKSAGHETYFQSLAFQRNLSGLPFPKDPMFTAEDLAHAKLPKDQGITLL